MTKPDTPSRIETFPAYALSALTTLLWVACVLPSGVPAAAGVSEDSATPIHRESILLVPALLLLIAVPAGFTLSRRRRGMRAVLASTDAFVMGYAGLALWAEGLVRDVPMLLAVLLLFLVGTLSAVEAVRCTRAAPRPELSRRMAGLRLALCLLVLILPLHLLVKPNVERASLLAPFLFVAISAAGARLARDMRGLRRTAAVLQLLLALHILVTLRYTIYRAGPTLTDINAAGRVTMGLGIATTAFALLQLLLLMRRRPGEDSSSRGNGTAQAAAGA